ncbi:hypothetical protein QYE76_018691 [Lolium multiflorum]|uniref:Gag-pol polyprotein n=1 Tax=Lolium multiflorum TaxID=4521 RepID=A0AAD8V9M0_LOLMU|nr:hypothetical protein QYE76_018691 [Lolium multiflorum]
MEGAGHVEGGGEIVIQQQMVREASSGSSANLQFPILTRGGYTSSAMVIEVNLQAASLLDAIEDNGVSRVDDKKTMAALLQSTPADMHCMLIGKGSTKAAWEAIKFQYQGPDRDGEKVQDFTIRISNLSAMMRSLGDSVDEEHIVCKFLSVVPTRFAQIAFSMETLLDPSKMTVEEVTGHLRAIEERLRRPRKQWHQRPAPPH